MNRCAQCGFENVDRVRFCGGCGVVLKTTAPGLTPPVGERTLVDQERPRPPTTASGGGTLVDAEAGGPGAGPLGLVGKKEQYEVLEEIGRGGMSVVFRARDRKLNRDVALKRLLPEFTQRPQAVARLMTEARSIANLQHPCIVSVHDIEQDEDGPYIAMEFVAGKDGKPQTLEQKVKQEGVLGERAAVELVVKLCGAVALAHSKTIFHRDIKPSNILLAADGTPKLLDFGIAHAAGDTVGETLAGLTQVGATLGTLDYMAPEQETDASHVDGRADIYGLGGVLHFCLTGASTRHFRESGVPADVRPVLTRALERDPAKRYRRVEEYSEALSNTLVGSGGTTSQTRAPEADEEEPPGEPLMDAGECARLGLPAIPEDVVAMHAQACELERTIRQLEKGRHPKVRGAREHFLEKEAQWEALQKELAASGTKFSDEVRRQIEQEVEQDSSGSDMRLCAKFPDVPGNVLLAYASRLRRMKRLPEEREQARRHLEEMVVREVTLVKQEFSDLLPRLLKRQREEYHELLGAFFARAAQSWKFPLEAWADLEKALARRGYRWGLAETFREAERRFDEFCWERCEKEATLAACESYLAAFPNGSHTQQARVRIGQAKDQQAWTEAVRAGTLEACERYLAAFPQGQYVSQARQKMDDLAWSSAHAQNSEELLAAYLQKWPQGTHREEAARQLEEVRDENAWAAAVNRDATDAFQAYLADWANGRHTAEAAQNLDRCLARRRRRQLVAMLIAVVLCGMAFYGWHAYSQSRLNEARKFLAHPDFKTVESEAKKLRQTLFAPWHHSEARQVATNLEPIRVEAKKRAEEEAARLAKEEAERKAQAEEGSFRSFQAATSAEGRFVLGQAFLKEYPDSGRRADVLMALLDDGSALLERSVWAAQPANLEALLAHARELLSKHPTLPALDRKVFAVATNLARLQTDALGPRSRARSPQVRTERRTEALDLLAALLRAIPETPLKSQIAEVQRQWQAQPGGNPGTPVVGAGIPAGLGFLALAMNKLFEDLRVAEVADTVVLRERREKEALTRFNSAVDGKKLTLSGTVAEVSVADPARQQVQVSFKIQGLPSPIVSSPPRARGFAWPKRLSIENQTRQVTLSMDERDALGIRREQAMSVFGTTKTDADWGYQADHLVLRVEASGFSGISFSSSVHVRDITVRIGDKDFSCRQAPRMVGGPLPGTDSAPNATAGTTETASGHRKLTVVVEGLLSKSDCLVRATPADKDGQTGGQPPLSLLYTSNAKVTLAAPVMSGYQFVGWWQDGVTPPVGRGLTLQVEMAQNRILHAKYLISSTPEVIKAPVIPQSSWAGKWEVSDWFGDLTIQQQKDRLSLSYRSLKGNGLIYPSSSLEARTLEAEWRGSGGLNGTLEFTLSPDNNSFTGRWRLSGSSTWNGVSGKRKQP